MPIYNFDTTELVSFFAAIIGLAIIIYAYFLKKSRQGTSLDKNSVRLMLIIFLFIVSNRFFTNIEAVAYKVQFNLIEHLSSLAAGFTAIVFSWKAIGGGKNRK